MGEVPEIARPVGRTRRVAGLIFLALGVILWVRMGWLVTFYGSWFGPDEWIRFGFFLWCGIVLAMVGCWLRYRSRVAGWVAILMGPVSFGLVGVLAMLGY